MKGNFIKKLGRTLALVLALCMVFAAFVGCGKKEKTFEASTDEVTLKWVMGGVGKLPDSDAVWAEFNKELQKLLPNTTVEFEVIPYSEFAEKWNLMAASREQVDIVWAGYMLDLKEEVRKGSFMELDALMEFAPDVKAEIPEAVIDLDRIGGKLYAIPCYQMMTNLPYGAKVQAEQAEKYGLDAEAITAAFKDKEPITKEDFKVFEDYLEKLKENGELKMGVSKSFLDQIMGYMKGFGQYKTMITSNAMIDVRDPELKVYDSLKTENDMAYYELVNEWFKKGYIRKDILSITDHAADEGKKEGYTLWAGSCFKGDSERMTAKYGFPVQTIPIIQRLEIPHRTPTTNTAISKTSVDPVRSMQLINLINSKKGAHLYNMLVFGLEGKHYKKVSDTEIEWLLKEVPGSSSNNEYGYDAWALGNTFNAYQTQFDTPGWNDYILNEVNEKAEPSPLIGFSLDPAPIKLEIAQYSAIWKEYLYLDLGATPNYKELIAERNEKLKKAGSDKIVEEVARQLDEWKKTK
jgi:putative aldouronate transport system substrate-binding protein